jgi:apolipoprotein D and lipocalin family protein
MLFIKSIAILLSLLTLSISDKCPVPPPAANYQNTTYLGTWYEIGRIQTAGGAIFQQSCVCTELLVNTPSPNTTGVDLSVTNSCRDKTPQGNFINATGALVNERQPGWYEEEFIPGLATVNYTIIAIGDSYSVEFDCGELFGLVNYCVHILSRTPTMDPELLSRLISFANTTLDLNIYNLPFNATNQSSCW